MFRDGGTLPNEFPLNTASPSHSDVPSPSSHSRDPSPGEGDHTHLTQLFQTVTSRLLPSESTGVTELHRQEHAAEAEVHLSPWLLPL